MSEIYHSGDAEKLYWDRRAYKSFDLQLADLKKSRTVYVGNVDPKTSERQIYEFFSRAGPVEKIIPGVNRINPDERIDFLFVVFWSREDAGKCVKLLHECILDSKVIKCELDPGWKPGREKGRGKKGGRYVDDDIPEIKRERAEKRMREEEERKVEAHKQSRQVYIEPRSEHERRQRARVPHQQDSAATSLETKSADREASEQYEDGAAKVHTDVGEKVATEISDDPQMSHPRVVIPKAMSSAISSAVDERGTSGKDSDSEYHAKRRRGPRSDDSDEDKNRIFEADGDNDA